MPYTNNTPVQYMATGGALSSPYANPMRTQMQRLGGGISSLASPQMAPAFQQQMGGQGMAPPTGMGQENIEPNFVNGPGSLAEKGAIMGPQAPTDFSNYGTMGPGSMSSPTSMGQESIVPNFVNGPGSLAEKGAGMGPQAPTDFSNIGTMGPGSMGPPPMQGVGGLFSEMNQGPSGGGGQPLGSYRSYLTDTYSQAQQEALSSRVNAFVDLVGRAEKAHFGNQGG
jgi:hypothetical protein